MAEAFRVFKPTSRQEDSSVITSGTEIFRMLKYFQNKFVLFIAVLFHCLSGAAPLLMNIMYGDLTTRLSTGENDMVKAIIPVVIKMSIINGSMVILSHISQFLREYCTPLFSAYLRSKIFDSIVEQEMSYFDTVNSGILVSRLSEDVTIVKEIYVDKSLEIIQHVITTIGGLIVALTTSWIVVLASLGMIIIITISYVIAEKVIGNYWRVYSDKSSFAASRVNEVISQIRTVKANDCEIDEHQSYDKILEYIQNIYKKSSIAHGIMDMFFNMFGNGLIAIVCYVACYLIIRKPRYQLVPGDVMTIMMSLMFASMSSTQIFSCSDSFRKANISSVKILELINKKPTISRKSGTDIGKIKGDIEFKNVSFKYPSSQTYAVEKLSFVIKSGETVAFVGESGCGKSTTLQLIQKFYEVCEGHILVDGHDIKNVSQISLRNNISCVSQSPILFSMSIEDNIKYSFDDAAEEDVVNAAKIGNAHNFINELQQKYQTDVSQTSLSGGQKQRICISRAMLANTPILLLDEATASLDAQSENLVHESIAKFRKEKTIIIVAHRLSTVQNADKIFVFSKGTIVESGTHNELLEKSGTYADLVKFQLK